MIKTNVFFKTNTEKDFKNIDRQYRVKLTKKIIKELSQNPYAGEKLLGKYSGLFRLRVGNYRVRYTIIKDNVLVLRISHRQSAYKK